MPGHGSDDATNAALIAFSEAVIRGTLADAASAGRTLAEVLGEQGLSDAAAVVAQFDAITRIADGSGIRLDKSAASATVDLRRDLGIDRFDTSVEAQA